tara:strand:+ start:194 stop:916 length:723 start_codon:yes stop_codon:yes gene_type:complete
MQKISTVIPVKNEEGNIIKLSQKILNSLKKYDNELIFVDDGSTDNTQKKIINLKKKYGKKIKGIIFEKNYGHQAALLAGLKLANGDYVFTIDGDLQDPPKYMSAILDFMIKNKFDVVNTIRNKRPGETLFRINFIKLLYFISKILLTKITYNSGDFRLVNSKAKKKIIKIKNKVFFLRSIMPKLKVNQSFYRYNRDTRQNGISKCNFIWLTNFAIQAFLASFNISYFKKYHTKYKINKFI